MPMKSTRTPNLDVMGDAHAHIPEEGVEGSATGG